MATSIRLSRGGSKKRPYYRIVVADGRSPRDGKFIEKIGTYNPLLAKDDEKRVILDGERAKHWLSVGAQPTDRVARFLDVAGVREREARNNPKKAEPGEKAKERAEERSEKAKAAEEAKAEAAAASAVEEAAAEEETVEVVAEKVEEATPEAEAAPEVEAEAAPEVEAEAAPAEEATNEGVSAEAPAEGADEPAAETASDDSVSAPTEGAAEEEEAKA